MSDELTDAEEKHAQEWLNSINAEIEKIHNRRKGTPIHNAELLANAIFWLKLVQDYCPDMMPFVSLMVQRLVLHAIRVARADGRYELGGDLLSGDREGVHTAGGFLAGFPDRLRPFPGDQCCKLLEFF